METEREFTEQNMYTVIEVWYGHDPIFEIIARGLVKSHLAKGLKIDYEFIMDLVRLSNEGWCNEEIGA